MQVFVFLHTHQSRQVPHLSCANAWQSSEVYTPTDTSSEETKPRKHLPLRSYFAECLKVVVFAMKTVFFASFRMRSMRNAQPPVKRDTSSPALPVLQLLCRPHNTLCHSLVMNYPRYIQYVPDTLFDLYMHFKSCHYCHKLIHNLYRTSGNYSWMNTFNFFNLCIICAFWKLY